jgi:hypothetical protein
MAYTPSSTPHHNSPPAIHIAAEKVFFETVKTGIESQINDYRLDRVKFFTVPEWNRNAGIVALNSGAVISRVTSFYNWKTLPDTLGGFSVGELEAKIINIAHQAIGAYTNAARLAVAEHGHDCGILHWSQNDNLNFIIRDWEPSVADPARLAGSSIAYNFKFCACKKEHIPQKQVTAELVKSWEGKTWDEIASKINEYFA